MLNLLLRDVLLWILLVCLINFMNLFGSFMNSYKYNHKYFIKFCDYVVNKKIILWEFIVKLYFNLVDLQNDW